MSIKQNGGVFGRNPTFNDVTIEGQLTFDGDIDINSDLKVDGNLEVTGNTSTDKITATGTYQNPLAVFNSTSGYGRIVFQENGTPRQWLQTLNGADGLKLMNGDGTTEVMRSQSNNISIANGNLVISTSGKGIDFSATAGTGTSELLSDYEEGTWTPTILFGGANAGMTFATQTGSYTKIGNLVSASCYISLSANGSSTGAATIGGLPFAAGSTALTFTAGSLYLDEVSFANFPQTWISYADQVMNLAEVTDAGVRTLITNANFVATSEIMMNVTYRV